jgi:hypothetical protein
MYMSVHSLALPSQQWEYSTNIGTSGNIIDKIITGSRASQVSEKAE